MIARRTPRLGLALAAAALVAAAPACAKRSDAMGAGEKVDFCQAHRIYSSFEEPDPNDPEEVEAYASAMVRVVDRVRLQTRIDVKKGPSFTVPPAVGEDLQVVKTSMLRLREEVRAAKGDKAKVREALNRALDDSGHNAADARLTEFVLTRCPDAG